MRGKRGFTLIELIIVIALIGVILAVGFNMFIFANRSHEMVVIEADIQHNVRIVAKTINDIIRDSSGVFVLSKEYPLTNIQDQFTDEWNYLMINKDKTKLIEWVWDGTKHVEKVLATAENGVTFDLVFNKDTAPDVDRLLEFTLSVNVNGNIRTVNSELESINTLQVVDRSYGNIANTLAYRSDPRLEDVAVAQAAVSFVIDRSGSMDYSLGASTRLAVLKQEATKMVEGLADNENVFLSISPFAYNANSSSGDNLNEMLKLQPNKDTFIGTGGIIPSLDADGGTNTGDGMRRGLRSIEAFNTDPANASKITKNFMIILVDGDTNVESLHQNITFRDYTFNSPLSHTYVSGSNTYTYEDWDENWWTGDQEFYYRMQNGSLHTVTSGPYPHNSIYDNITLRYTSWNDYWNDFYYHYDGPTGKVYVVNDQNVSNAYYGNINNLPDNQYFANGVSVYVSNNDYIQKVVNQFNGVEGTDYKVRTFVIGFTSGASSSGLQAIANATKSIDGTNGTGTYKYYVADTGAALNAVLEEIKFQISDALWHIGGPN